MHAKGRRPPGAPALLSNATTQSAAHQGSVVTHAFGL
jgi:hypothetical protein